MLDTLPLKNDGREQKTLDIEAEAYEKLIDLSTNYFNASVSKIINMCILDLAEKDQVVMTEIKDLEKHTVILTKSTVDCLNSMKKKFNIPIYVLVNTAIREGIQKLEKKIK